MLVALASVTQTSEFHPENKTGFSDPTSSTPYSQTLSLCLSVVLRPWSSLCLPQPRELTRIIPHQVSHSFLSHDMIYYFLVGSYNFIFLQFDKYTEIPTTLICKFLTDYFVFDHFFSIQS